MSLRAHPAPSTPGSLRYIARRDAGILRLRRGRGFNYLHTGGASITDKATLDRIAALVLPPAWKDVWICPDPRGHIQATGIDARGRLQYRYHAEWTAHRNLRKFDSLPAFARVLPRIRRRIRRDLTLPGMPRDKVLACIVQILDTTHIRVGNAEYARDNHSYGLTTIRNNHATVRGKQVRLRFRAKSGKDCDVALNDPRIAAIVRRCQDLPGQELFAYLDDRGRAHDVTSADVNDYLRRITGQSITAKDFRTWAGTTIAAESLLAAPYDPDAPLSKAQLKRTELAAVRAAAAALNNTVATCRKFYVHPGLAAAHANGTLARIHEKARSKSTPRELRAVERLLVCLLGMTRANVQGTKGSVKTTPGVLRRAA